MRRLHSSAATKGRSRRGLGHHARTPRSSGQQGVTLIEVLVSIVVLGIIITPLCASLITGLRTTASVADRVQKADDAKRIDTYWTKDVQSVSASVTNLVVTNGVPTGTIVNGVSEGTACGTPAPPETPLVSFSWGPTGSPTQPDGTANPNYVPATTASWVVDGGPGPGATLVRRVCVTAANGTVSQNTNLIANDFWDNASTPLNQIIHGGYNGTQNPDGSTTFCTAPPPLGTTTVLESDWTCTIVVAETNPYQLTVRRRVLPVGTTTPTNPVGLTVQLTGVAAIPGSTQAWAVGPDCALDFYSGSGATYTPDLHTPSGCAQDLYGVTPISSTAAFAVGKNGTILRCSTSCNTVSAVWTQVTTTPSTTQPLYAVASMMTDSGGGASQADASAVLAVGGGGTVFECSSNCATTGTFTQASSSAFSGLTLTGVAMAKTVNASDSAGYAFITASGLTNDKGNLLRCTSNCLTTGTWTLDSADVPTGTGQLIAIGATTESGNGGQSFVAVGASGAELTCVDCGAHGWSTQSSGSPQDLVAASVDFKTGILAVGDGGSVSSCEGTINACGSMTLRGFRPIKFTGVSRSDTGSVSYFLGTGGTFLVGNSSGNPTSYTFLTCSGTGC